MFLLTNVVVVVVVVLLTIVIVGNAGRTDWSIEKNASFWNEQARVSIEQIIQRQENMRRAKNVIMFLGDGMGVSTVTAGRIRKGQMKGQLGEDFLTEMEQFSYSGLAKTYNINHQTADSAATATAYLCGVKARLGTIGVDGRAIRGDCSSSIGTNVPSILDWAQQAGKKVGIITTTRITHATPAAAYAHVADRNWESYNTNDFGVNHTQQGCVDIALQLVSRSTPIDLIFGGGRRFFYPNTIPDMENPTFNGSRTDNRSLIKEFWHGDFIWNKTAMDKIQLGSPKPIMGLFERDHMYYETDRIANQIDDPSLSQMTKFAIEHFLKFNQGFFLLIEGGKIDHGHHATQPRYALDEFVEFDNAIGQAKQILKEQNLLDETLLVVTADHSHVFTFGAYATRGSNILGFASSKELNGSDVDHLPINIIAYGNGPNFNSPRNAIYAAALDTNLTSYLAPTALPLKSETHGGEDVPVFAQGPWSHLFTGTMEQNTIAHKMAYAACWGAYANRTGCQSIIISIINPKLNAGNSFYQIAFSEIFINFFLLFIVF